MFEILGGGDPVTWSTVIVALISGAVGAAVALLLAFGAWLFRIARELDANSRAVAVHNRHLETWVCDATIDLMRTLRQIEGQLDAENILRGATYQPMAWRAKEKALHSYRDQERTSMTDVANVAAREGWLHTFIRGWKGTDRAILLTASEDAAPILDFWASTPTLPPRARARHMPKFIGTFDDPRKRSFENVLAMLTAYPEAIK